MEATALPAVASSGLRGMHPRGALRALLNELDTRHVHATPRAVAVALWTFTNRHGGSWPSQKRLARLTGRCERTVRSAVKALEGAGVILRAVPELRQRRTRRATTVYRLLAGDAPPPTAAPVAPATPLPLDLAATIDRVAALVAAPPPELVFLPPEPLNLAVAELAEHLATEHLATEHLATEHLATEEPAGATATPSPDLAAADAPEAHEEPAPKPLNLAAAELAITGNGCRTREPTPTEPFRLAREATPDVPPPALAARAEPNRQTSHPHPLAASRRSLPAPRRRLAAPAALSPPALPRESLPGAARTARLPPDVPPPALAALFARCAALVRRR